MAASVLEKLNLTHEEMSRLTKAMKDPTFMTLLDEYSREISEPGSKEEAEGYIKMMEDRTNFSMDGKELIVPQVDFCAKTRNKITNGKVFINICHSEKVAKPTATPRSDKSGVQWEIPYSLAPTRRDKDKVGNDCEVHDFVVNTETHSRAEESRHFKKFLVETAMDAIEKQRGVKLDRDFSLPKLSYKGPTKTPKLLTIPKDKIASKEKIVPKDAKGASRKKPDLVEKPMVPRSPSHEPAKHAQPSQNDSKLDSPTSSAAPSARDVDSSKSYSTRVPEMDNTSEGSFTAASYIASTSDGSGSESVACRRESSQKDTDDSGSEAYISEPSHSSSQVVEPPYELIYRNTVDYGDFWADNSRSLKGHSGPQEILLRVFLPEVTSAEEIELDMCDCDIVLKVVGKYFLKVALSFAVDESKSVAKFDKNKMKLELTLPTCISTAASGKGCFLSTSKCSSERASDCLSDDVSDDFSEKES